MHGNGKKKVGGKHSIFKRSIGGRETYIFDLEITDEIANDLDLEWEVVDEENSVVMTELSLNGEIFEIYCYEDIEDEYLPLKVLEVNWINKRIM